MAAVGVARSHAVPGRRFAAAALPLLTGALVNKWSVEQMLAPDGHLENPLYVTVIVAFQGLLIASGLWLLWRRSRAPVRLGRTLTVILAGLAVGGAVGTVRATLPVPWQADGVAMVERLEMIASETTLYKLDAERETRLYKLRHLIGRARQLAGLPENEATLERRMLEADYLLQHGDTRGAIRELETIRRIRAASGAAESDFDAAVRDLLAIAYLRMGEQDNCIARHTPHMCYVPLSEQGVYTLGGGSRAAIAEFMRILEDNPEDLSTRWLLNIAHMTLGSYPEEVPARWLIPEARFASDVEVTPFRDVASELGVDVLSLSGGSILEDFNRDGRLDLMISSTGLRDQLRYFEAGADGTFAERTTEAGLTGQVGGLNISHADYDNDGYPDVLVLRGAWLLFDDGSGNHPNSLLRNNGDGTFTDVTERAGLLGFHSTQVGAWGDYDNDGWVDLFVGNESAENQEHPPELFHNNGDGTFSEVARSAGLDAAAGFIKGAAWGDYDNDGRLDLYVSRLGESNLLYRNAGAEAGWTFTDVTAKAGVGEPVFSFPAWFWDYDNDGWEDIFVAGFAGPYEGVALYDAGGTRSNVVENDAVAPYVDQPIRFANVPRLYRNNGNGTFSDVTRGAGLDRVVHVMGANFGDIDNDGYLDLYLGTGTASYRSLMPNRMYRSDGGARFQDVTTSAVVGHLQKGHGISFGDIDNDGDEDIYAELGGWYEGDVFRNALYLNPGHGNHWITLRLEGVTSNRLGMDARITIVLDTPGGERRIHRTVSAGGSFGASSLQQEIGLGRALAIRRIEVFWPASGTTQSFANVSMNQIARVREGHPTLLPAQPSASALAASRGAEN